MTKVKSSDSIDASVQELVRKARIAQKNYESFTQEKVDAIVRDIGKFVYDNAESLARMAVDETEMGSYEDKILKNHNKTLGLMRDLKDVISFGHVCDDVVTGLSSYLRPKGIVAAIVPSTNPLATPVNNIINALKTGNAIILAPSPKGVKPLTTMLTDIHQALGRLGLPDNLVQMVPAPPSRAKTERLMKLSLIHI